MPFIFEARLNRQTVRATIGDVRAWTLDDARTEPNRADGKPGSTKAQTCAKTSDDDPDAETLRLWDGEGWR